MERIAAVVEGHLEAHFFNETYPKVLVQRCIPNGDDVDLSLIVEAIGDQLDIIDGSVRKVVVLLDREKRAAPAKDIVEYLRTELCKVDPSRFFYVGVCDREVENWILADIALIEERYKVNNYAYCGDGVAGKSRLAAITGGDLAPRDKARLLKATSPTRVGSTSPSLAHFVTQIDFPWYWASS